MKSTGIDRNMHESHEYFIEVKELKKACITGDSQRVSELLKKHPNVIDSPDRDERFTYPASELWSPLYLTAVNGHEKLVRFLLEKGANPVPFEVAAQYHQDTYSDWMDLLRERGYDSIVQTIESAIEERYGTLLKNALLRQAVMDGNVELVGKWVAEEPEYVKKADAVGNTLLHLAVAANQIEIARLLVQHGASVDAQNGDGRTPAIVALFGLHRYWRLEVKRDIVDFLLSQGAECTLLIAATIGDEQRVQEILNDDPSAANQADHCYRRPLSGAVSGGHKPIVRMLLNHGADPNAKEAICQGGLSLRIAAEQGDVEMVQMLLDHGAIPDHFVDSSGDAMYAAYTYGHERILHMLYAYGGTMELQVYAANYRIDVIAEVLRAQPSRADEVLPYGWEDNGNEDLAYHIMKIAIRYGARFEQAAEWKLRWTLIKYPKVFRLLLEHGANPDLPLLAIAGDMRRRYRNEEERLQAIRFLIEECGADVNVQDEEGYTPLAKAAEKGHTEVVKLLLSKGAAIKSDAPDWAQPLFLAEQRGYTSIVQLFRSLLEG